MSVNVIVGTQWGDEGKGKITDLLAKKVDLVVRYQGGNNAGHTVVINKKTFKLHLIPSGIFYPHIICVIGNGVVIDPEVFLQEVATLKDNGINVSPKNLKISKTAHVILSKHKERDCNNEEAKDSLKIGTTKRGIGPSYEDKINRSGLRAEQYAKELEPYLVDSVLYLDKAIKDNKNILLEGAQGTMLDIDHGTYPFVTSSNPTAGGSCTGSGIGPTKIDKVIGIAKAYCTRVGEGPFPTELNDSIGIYLREKGAEYGTTTGRNRRCGWFDIPVLKHAVRVNGLTELVITKLDVLDDLDEIQICTGYNYKGNILKDYPSDINVLIECIPVLKSFPGWNSDITEISSYSDLPKETQNYLNFIEQETGVPIRIVSVGADRTQTVWK